MLSGLSTDLELSLEKVNVNYSRFQSPKEGHKILKWSCLQIIDVFVLEFCVAQMKTLLKYTFNSKCVKIWFEFLIYVSSVCRGISQYKSRGKGKKVGDNKSSDLFSK